MAFLPIPADEAIRRIQERDHAHATEEWRMTFENEQQLIEALRDGDIFAGYDLLTRELAFQKTQGGTPFEVQDGQCRT